MKKVMMMLALAAMTVCFSAKAQNFDQSQLVFLVFNYENGIYNGRTEQELAAYEVDWYKDRPRYEGRFLEGYGDKQTPTARILLIRTEKQLAEIEEITAPVLRVNIIAVDKKGNLRASVSCTAPNHPGMRAEKSFNSRGGTFGTWLNLFGDGMERLGEQVAVWLAGEF